MLPLGEHNDEEQEETRTGKGMEKMVWGREHKSKYP